MDEKIRKTILIKLYRQACWGGKHTSFDNLPKGFPSHLRGQVKDAAKELIKEGLLLCKPTHYGLEVSLNIKRKQEIEQIIEN
jgi:hypothetical protein